MKLSAHRAGLPGNVDMITVSAFLPAYKAGHSADLPVKRRGIYSIQTLDFRLQTFDFFKRNTTPHCFVEVLFLDDP